MIGQILRSIFRPHHTPPPPRVELSSEFERRRIDEQQREIAARLERLRLEAERPALRRIYKP